MADGIAAMRFGRGPRVGLGLLARIDVDQFAHRGGQGGIGDVSGAIGIEGIGPRSARTEASADERTNDEADEEGQDKQ